MRQVSEQLGFTIPEVIIAGIILIIICLGLLTSYSTVVNLNRGNDIRSQAHTVLQREVEEFRSFRFVPGTTDPRLNAGSYPTYKTGVTSADNTPFNIIVRVDNNPFDATSEPLNAIADADCKFKQITIEAVMQRPETGWLADLRTKVEIQRVRSN